MKQFKLLSIFAIAVLVLLGSCKKEKDPFKDVQITFDSESYEVFEGKSISMFSEITITPESADTITISWSSSNENIAKVSDSGSVLGVSEGEATITASSHGKSVSCKVTVKSIPINAFSLRDKMLIAANIKSAIPVDIVPDDASLSKLQWETTVPDVMPQYDAENVQWYLLTSYVGEATITARYGDCPDRKCAVTITEHPTKPISSFALTWQTSPSSFVGFNTRFNVYACNIMPADADYSGIEFTIDDPSLASISTPDWDANSKQYKCALTTKNKAGTLRVTATDRYSGESHSFSLFIEKKDIEKVSLPETDIVVQPGNSTYMGTVGYTITPADASVSEVTFSIKNEDGVEVGENIMAYKKILSSRWDVEVGSGAPAGRYSITAIADGVMSKPMYVNVINKEWLEDNIVALGNGSSHVYPSGNGYRVILCGCLGIRQHISPRYLLKNFDTMDESLKNAFTLEYEGGLVENIDNRGKSFYFLQNYAVGDYYNYENGKLMTLDYAFRHTTMPGAGGEIKPAENTFNMRLYVQTGASTFNVPLYMEVYTSFYNLYYSRVDYDGNESSKEWVDYDGGCIKIENSWHGKDVYQKGLNLYISYSASGTAGSFDQYNCWYHPVEINGGKNENENAYFVSQWYKEEPRLPFDQKYRHITIRWCAASAGCDGCKYDPAEYK